MACNQSETQETVVVATFLGVPEDGPLTLPLDAEQGAELDDRGGIER
jgi:hypothetical protein